MNSVSFNSSLQVQPIKALESIAKLAFGQEKPFPAHWGQAPEIQTADWVKLPGGFGYGSSTIKNWILENFSNDAARFEKPLPVAE